MVKQYCLAIERYVAPEKSVTNHQSTLRNVEEERGRHSDPKESEGFFITVIIIITIIIIISFVQGTYTHIPETNYVPREHGVAAILLFLFMVLISLLAVLNLLYF